jgi:hypothetical protein
LTCDLLLVVSQLKQFKDFGSDRIQTEHLAPSHIQKDSSIWALGPSDGVRDGYHGMADPSCAHRPV